ncbi:membrane protein [Streptomyces sp. DconLS]|nr:membrane protein [Streptomyces sp. DconLS]
MSRLRRGLHRAWRWIRVQALFAHGRELELMHRAMGFATLALVTLAPLLIVVAAADPLVQGGFASWLTDGMGLSGPSARVVTDVISPPHNVIGTTSAWSAVLLAVFGVSFGAACRTPTNASGASPPGPGTGSGGRPPG